MLSEGNRELDDRVATETQHLEMDESVEVLEARDLVSPEEETLQSRAAREVLDTSDTVVAEFEILEMMELQRLEERRTAPRRDPRSP